MFGSVDISDEYFVSGLVYIKFKTLLKYDIHADSTTKYLDMLKVLPDFCLRFFEYDDYLICYTSCWQLIS